MTRHSGLEATGVATRTRREALVCLLIPTHALPPLNYRVPNHLREMVVPGAAVVVPLSGHSRLGVVVEVEKADKASEPVYGVVKELNLPAELAEVCRRVSEATAVPLSNVLCAALTPSLKANRYRVLNPADGWSWAAGSQVTRAGLRRHLGSEGLKAAEKAGRVRFDPGPPDRRLVEWAVVRGGARPDLGRAPRQRELFERLSGLGGASPVPGLLEAAEASRATMRELVKRGAIKIQRRPEPPPVLRTRGGSAGKDPGDYSRDAGRVVDRGGAWLWRLPSSEHATAVASVTGAAVEGGEQVLVLVPEVKATEQLAGYLCKTLPAGNTVATYHSARDRDRETVYRMARNGEVDVVIGTRAAALLPMPRLGAICVVDEPDEAHRALPGYEGLQAHVRDVILEREEVEGPGVVLLSAVPSLRLYARKDRVRELAARPPDRWPAARVVDLRGSGAVLSEELISAADQGLRRGDRIALIANRLGYASSVSCNRCGTVQTCPACDLPLALHEPSGSATCGRCGYRSPAASVCGTCGSERLSPIGLGVERLRREVSRALGVRVGMLTANRRELQDATVVVGTAKCITEQRWSTIVVADSDAWISGSGLGAEERGFRMLYSAAAAADDLVIVQTRTPEHYALRCALGADYPAFAAAELPRLRALGYPPFGHLVALTLRGDEDTVRRAVESSLRSSLEPGVDLSQPVPVSRPGDEPVWRALLRCPDRGAAARSGMAAARLAARYRGKNKLKVHVEVNPEEV